MIAYKASPLHSSVRLGEGAGGDPKKSKVKSLFISPTNKPKEVKKETQEPPSRSKSVNGQDVTQPTYYIDQFNKIPVQDTPTQAINEQVTAKNNPNLTPNTQAQNLYPSVQDETTQIPKNPILTGEQPAGEVKQFNELPAIQMLKDNLFMTGALKQPIDTYMSGREDFFKGDTSKGFQKGVMSLAELTSIPFTALDQITRQIPDVGNDIADISTAPFVVLGEAGKDINKSIREFLGIKLQDPEQEKLADELAGVFMQFAVPMVGGKLMGLTKTGLKKLTEVKGVIETIPEPLRTPENVQKLLTEGTKFKNIVDPQGNVVREKIPTGDLTSTPIDKIIESQKNIEKNPNIPIDLPQLDVNAGLREVSPTENFNIFKGLEPSKRQQFNEQVKPKLDEWVNDSKTPEDFLNKIQREYYIGGTKKGDIISKMLVDLGYTREGALPNNPFNAYTEYYNLFKKEETVNPKYKESIETVLTDAEKKRATDFVDIKRHGNLNLNSVKDGIRLDAGKIKKGLNDIKNGNFETVEAKQVAYNINKAYENGIKGNNERGDFSNSFMSAEELKSISETNKDINVKAQPYENNVKIIKDAISKKSLDMSGLSKLVDMTDKKVLKATYEIARYHFENGIQKFGDWARQMVKDAGDWIKPHLKRLWSEVKAYATGDKAFLDPNTLGLFGGGSAKEFNLAKEQSRTFEGKYDKKTRFEIDDSKARLKVDFHDAWGEGQTKFKLGDVLDHPELFKNYPEFKDIDVKVTTGSEYQGSYSPKDNTIRISLNNTDGNKSTLLHELQHGIQEVENFARGGNISSGFDRYDKKAVEQLYKIEDNIGGRHQELSRKIRESGLKVSEKSELETLRRSNPKTKDIQETIDKSFEEKGNLTPREFYNNLAGEIESRDVQARMDYTKEQRKQIPPYSSENISPNDAIVNYESGQSNLTNKKGTRKVDPDRIQQGEKQSEFTPNEKTIHGDIRKEIKDIMNKDLDLMRELRRNKITDQQALKKATEIGVKIATEGDKFFDKIKVGDVFPIEEHLGIVAYATKRVKDVLADKTATPTQKFDVMTMFYKAEAISGELGRSLRGRQLIERLPIDDIKGLGKDILDAPDIPQEHKDAVSGMLDDMQKRPNLIHQPNWYDKLRYVFYNAMLSRPLTHLRNIAGNTFHLAYEYALNPVSPVKALRNAEFKKTLAKVWKEGGDVSKFTEGMYEPKNPLVRNAMPTSWLKFEDIVFKEIAKGIQKTREAKSIMKDFGGDYDVVIKAINNVMEGKTIGNEKINTRLQKAVDGIEEYAKYVTFQKDLGNVGTKFQSWLKSIKGSELIVPFVRTPANILKVGLQPLKVLKYLTKEQRAKFNEMTPVEKRMEITRITAGAVAYTVLYQLASNNVIDITGQGAEDKSKRDFMEKQGWKPNSIKIGDRYYSYQNIQPFNVGLGIVGNYLDGIKYNSKPKDNELEWYQKWSKTLAGFVATTTDQSFLSGLSELAKWQQTKNPYYLEGFVNSFIPGILSVGKDFTTDTNAYDTKTVGEKLKSRTGLTDGLRPRINVFGEPEKSQGTGLPFTVIPPKLGEQETPDEMSKLFLDNNVTISYPKKDMVKADGQKVSDEEYYDFVKESGQRIKKKLDENFELLKTMDSGTMNDEIDRVVNDIRNTVKDEMFGKKERTKKQYKIKL